MADFDIEGFKIGMSEEETVALLKEKCEDGQFDTEIKTSRNHDVLHSKEFYCRIKESNEKIEIIGRDKIYTIIGRRDIRHPDGMTDADREEFFDNIHKKILEKYGPPTYKMPELPLPIIEMDPIGQVIASVSACWGDCSIAPGVIKARENLFAAVGLQNESHMLSITRALTDNKARKNAEEIFNKEIENLQKQEIEKAKKQSQDIKF